MARRGVPRSVGVLLHYLSLLGLLALVLAIAVPDLISQVQAAMDTAHSHKTQTGSFQLVKPRARQSPPRTRQKAGKFTVAFDEVFRCEAIRIIRTPARAPQANAIAERRIGSIRHECLDRS